MFTILMFGGGFVFGVLVAYVFLMKTIASQREKISQLGAQLLAEQTQRDRELKMLTESYEQRLHDMRITEEKLGTTFKATAAHVLDANAKQFHEVAEKDLRQVKTEATGELDQRKQAFESLVKNMQEQLGEAKKRIDEYEKERVDMFGKITEQMRAMWTQEQKLISETQGLKTALTSSSSVRGRWGELVLKNILTNSQMVEGVDFIEQSSTSDEEGNKLRPDVLVKLPNTGKMLAIDAKAPLYQSFIDAENTEDIEKRGQLLGDFVKKVRERVTNLAGKAYEQYISDSVPYVVMFIPSEAAVRAVFDADPDLFQWAADKKVMITSPSTIMPLVLLIASAGRQFKFFSQANEILKTVNALGERLGRFVDRLGKVQSGIESASKAWNDAVEKSWLGQQGVLKSLEKVRDLGAAVPEDAELPIVSVDTRRLPEQSDSGQQALLE